MSWTQEVLRFKFGLLSVEKYPFLDDPQQNLRVFVTPFGYKRLASRTGVDEISFVGAFVESSNFEDVLKSHSSLLARVDVSSELREDETAGNKLTLYVTWRFITHYCLRESDSNQLYFTRINCAIPLARVIVGVEDEVLLQEMTRPESEWHKKLLANVCDSRDISLCRANDFLFGDKHIRVLDCEPAFQGILTLKTKLIVTKWKASRDTVGSPFSPKAHVNYLAPNLMSRLLLPFQMKSDAATALSALKSEARDPTQASVPFRVVIMDQVPPDFAHFDSENSILVSTKSLFKLKCQPGAWMQITLRADESHNGLNPRLVKVVTLPNANEEVALISPQLWFNLNKSGSSRQPLPLLKANTEIMVDTSSAEYMESSPESYVTAVHVALVQSPDYSGSNDFSSLLSSYFSTPRYVVTGDIIGLPVEKQLCYHHQVQDISRLNWPVVYFKVALIEGTGALIDNKHSKLYQTGTTKSYVPKMMSSYYSGKSTNSFRKQVKLEGLTHYVDKLSDIVFPYLSSLNSDDTLPTILLTGSPGCGKRVTVRSLCNYLNLHLYEVDANEVLTDTPGATEAKLKIELNRAAIYAPCLLLVSNVDVLCKDNSGNQARIAQGFLDALHESLKTSDSWPIITIMTTSSPDLVYGSDLGSLFLHQMTIECPTEGERKSMLNSLLKDLSLAKDVNVSLVAQRTAGYVLGDLCTLVSNAVRTCYRRIASDLDANGVQSQVDAALAGFPLKQNDLMASLEEMIETHAQSIGAPQMPNVKWEDVGGLISIKREILDTIQLPLEHPELLETGLKRSGVLLYGPPGTGKTLLAKAVATECSLNFLSVKGPELINMYVGQSEANVREVFRRARDAVPCVIFFDELDSLAPNRGRSGDSGGVMDRVVSQLLAEMDGMNKSNQVFIIGATNRPDLLDPALLRPGRFDRLLYVGIAEEPSARLKILEALTRKFKLDPGLDLGAVEAKCPRLLTGADFYALCSTAMMRSLSRCVADIEAGKVPEEEAEFGINFSDFLSAFESLVPSVSSKEMERYEKIRNFMAK